MRILMMLTGLAARLLRRANVSSEPGGETDGDRRAAEALVAMRDANEAMAVASANAAKSVADFGDAANRALATLGDCYHDAVAYSLAYDANGCIELCGETFTSLDTGIDGGARAALRRHRQNFDSGRDIPRFIVALKPVKVVEWRSSGDIKSYGLAPGPLAANPIVAKVWGEHVVTTGGLEVIRRAMDAVKRDCERHGVDISKSMVTISVRPHDGQDAFARCEKSDTDDYDILDRSWSGPLLKHCDECSSPYCECDGTCDSDYATSCHRCDTWVCAYCVVEGACHNCFSKMQGGVH